MRKLVSSLMVSVACFAMMGEMAFAGRVVKCIEGPCTGSLIHSGGTRPISKAEGEWIIVGDDDSFDPDEGTWEVQSD